MSLAAKLRINNNAQAKFLPLGWRKVYILSCFRHRTLKKMIYRWLGQKVKTLNLVAQKLLKIFGPEYWGRRTNRQCLVNAGNTNH